MHKPSIRLQLLDNLRKNPPQKIYNFSKDLEAIKIKFNNKYMPFRTTPAFILFFVLPSIIYAGLITQFSFDFFTYDYLWKAYNSLALSILDGRLDIPYESIGRESLYYDGKVYMYYGSLPVLFRIVLAPFVDLNTLPLGKLFVWLTTTIGAASLQYAILKYSVPNSANFNWNLTAKIKIVILSLIVWFGGAHTIIIQKGIMYHEVYAAMLMLCSLFIATVWRDVFKNNEARKYNLITYACIAALALHTRQTVAIGLYLAVLVLICLSIVDQSSRNTIKSTDWKSTLTNIFEKGFYPLTILFIGGAILLLLNYLRFDDPFSMTRGRYGFTLAGEIASERFCAQQMTGSSRFELYRVIPNLIYYLIGGGYTHSKIINWIGIGYVRKELTDVFLLIFLWSSLILSFLLSLAYTIKQLKHGDAFREKSILLLLAAFCIGTILTLSYTTITLRYAADLWLPLGFMLLVFSNIWLTGEVTNKQYLKKFVLYLFIFSTIVNISYNSHLYNEYKKWSLLENTVNGLPGQTVLEKLYKPEKRSLDIDEGCSSYNFNTEMWHERLFK